MPSTSSKPSTLSSSKVIVLTADGSSSSSRSSSSIHNEDGANNHTKCSPSSSSLLQTLRLDKMTPQQINADSSEVHHVVGGGPFEGVIVNKTAADGLPPVRKANIRMEFNAYMRNTNKDSSKSRLETRQLLFWFKKKVNLDEQKAEASQFFKLLIEPETFPTAAISATPPAIKDYVGYVKKVISLFWRFRHMTRVQLNLQLEPEPEPAMAPIEEEEPLIENFITVLTPAVYDYQYLPEVAVSKKSHVTFRVRAAADAHIAMSMAYGDTDRKTYEVTLGATGNSISTIKYGGRGLTVAQVKTPDLLAADDFKQFWISWDSNVLQVGNGSDPGESRFMRWPIPKDKLHSINCVSVSTGPGSDGQWEFIEYISPTSERSESSEAKRAKLRRGILWHAKKTKMLQTLEEAFPSSLDMTALLRRSLVSLSDMLEAVVFLKDLESKGLVIELSRGVWLRAPVANRKQSPNELVISAEFPSLPQRDAPTVAIVTTLFCERMAVDAMLDAKTTYVRHNTETPINGGMTQSYTLGRIGEFRVVTTKIPLLYSNFDTTEWHGTILSSFLAMFDQVQHVIVVGSGGAVPNYSNYERHVRLGDIAVSVPQSVGGPLYLHCQDIYHGSDGERSYATRVWDARQQSATDAAARKLVDFYCGGMPPSQNGGVSGRATLVSRRDAANKRPWERSVEEVQRRLETELDETTAAAFLPPPIKTDRLFAVIEPGTEPVIIKHPAPSAGCEHLVRDGLPNIRCGTIASGRLVASNITWRREVADGIVAYDRGLHEIIEVLDSCSQLNSFCIVLGMCDYNDGSRGRTWQPYSALCAAAFTKTLISTITNQTTQTRRSSYYH